MTKIDVGIDDTQLRDEEEIRERIQQQRVNDPHMALQVSRAAFEGDIESLSPEQREQLFNPDGKLPAQVVEQRIEHYKAQHGKVAFEAHELRPQVAGVGKDPETQQFRMPAPGERVHPDTGLIEMVDPKYADQVADKIKRANAIDVKNSMQRSIAMNEVVMQVMNRVPAPTGVCYVTFEEERALAAQYDEERKLGWPEWKHDYLPVRAYVHKIGPKQLPNGTWRRPVRQLAENECGVFQMGSNPSSRLKGKTVCMRDKNLTHTEYTQIQVPRTESSPTSPDALPGGSVLSESISPTPPQATTPPSPMSHSTPTVGAPRPLTPKDLGMEDPNKDLPPPPPGFGGRR